MRVSKKKLLSILFIVLPTWSYGCADNAATPFYEENPYFGEGKAFTVVDVESFFDKLRNAVLEDDVAWLKDSIRYPLSVKRNDTELLITSSSDFASNYSVIFNNIVKKAVRCQKFNELFANWQGIRVGSGAVWFTRVLRDEIQNDDARNDSEMVGKVDYENAESAMNAMGDPDKWRYEIFAISDGTPVVEYVKNCK